MFRGTYDFESAPFDWGGSYSRPALPLKDLVIYEVLGKRSTLSLCRESARCTLAWAAVGLPRAWAAKGGARPLDPPDLPSSRRWTRRLFSTISTTCVRRARPSPQVPVRGFTADPGSSLAASRRGTFLGLADKASPA